MGGHGLRGRRPAGALLLTAPFPSGRMPLAIEPCSGRHRAAAAPSMGSEDAAARLRRLRSDRDVALVERTLPPRDPMQVLDQEFLPFAD